MRTDTPQPIRLADYHPPAFVIESAHLDFVLAPSATRVRAKLAIRRQGEHAEPLRLDGEMLEPISFALEGRPLAAGEYVIDGEGLTVANVPDCFTPGERSRDRSGREQGVGGALHVGRPVFVRNARRKDSAGSPGSPTGRIA